MEPRLVWIITALVLSVITLAVCIALNATIARNPYSGDLGRNTGWILLMPMPATSTVWAIVDLGIYKLGAHHCVYWLVQSVLLFAAYVTMGIMGIMPYSWGNDDSWVMGMFHLIMAVFYSIAIGFAAKTVHFWRQQQVTKATRAKDVDLSHDQTQIQQPHKTSATS